MKEDLIIRNYVIKKEREDNIIDRIKIIIKYKP